MQNLASPLSLTSRRTAIHCGVLGLAGAAVPSVGGVSDTSTAGQSTHRPGTSCIMFFLDGGPSHHETFDPKPEAPATVRGEFGATETTVPGFRVCDRLPLLARQAHHFSVVRSLFHGNNSHAPSEHQMMTGRMGTRDGTRRAVIETPSIGSIVSRLRGTRRTGMPAYVGIPWSFHHSYIGSPFGAAAYLGSQHEPFESGHLPASATTPYKVPILELQDGLSTPRLKQRQQLLSVIDRFRQDGPIAPALGQIRNFTRQGMDLLLQDQVRDAFDLGKESTSTREEYGAHEWGQGALLARRLVESGVTFTLIQCGLKQDWDTHKDNFKLLDQYLPRIDRAVAALLADLATRGLLDTTMVMVIGEFGRTPKINKNAGRDHWGDVFSAMIAGGGLRGGQVVGSSDAIGAYPAEHAAHAQDLFATMYHRLGIDTDTVFHDHQDRPIPVLNHGSPIQALL